MKDTGRCVSRSKRTRQDQQSRIISYYEIFLIYFAGRKAFRANLRCDTLNLQSNLIDFGSGDQIASDRHAHARDRMASGIKNWRGYSNRPGCNLTVGHGKPRLSHLLEVFVDLFGRVAETNGIANQQGCFLSTASGVALAGRP